MARTALYAPAHRVMGRYNAAVGSQAQPPTIGPSFDAAGVGIQDGRWKWNSGGSSATAPQIIGWMDPGTYPVLDVVMAALNAGALAAAQVPTAGTPMTLVASSGNGVVVPTTPTQMFPGGALVPVTARFIHAVTQYVIFGYGKQRTYAYDPTTQIERCITVTSVGNDSTATMALTGIDQYGYTIHQTVTMANAGVVTTGKGFKALLSAVPAGTLSGSNVSIGTSDTIGLPFYAAQQSQLWGYWNNLILYGTGTFTAGVTTTSTATTGDTAGTWTLPSASDGSKRLTLWMRPNAAAMATSGINTGLTGVFQF
jgi:hypothetical protein